MGRVHQVVGVMSFGLLGALSAESGDFLIKAKGIEGPVHVRVRCAGSKGWVYTSGPLSSDMTASFNVAELDVGRSGAETCPGAGTALPRVDVQVGTHPPTVYKSCLVSKLPATWDPRGTTTIEVSESIHNGEAYFSCKFEQVIPRK